MPDLILKDYDLYIPGQGVQRFSPSGKVYPITENPQTITYVYDGRNKLKPIYDMRNQLIPNGNFVGSEYWSVAQATISVLSGVATITATDEYATVLQGFVYNYEHVYLVEIDAKIEDVVANTTLSFVVNGDSFCLDGSAEIDNTSTEWQHISVLLTGVTGNQYSMARYGTQGHVFYVKNANLHDITEIVGSGNEPSTVSGAEEIVSLSHKLTASYYPYRETPELGTGENSFYYSSGSVITHEVPSENVKAFWETGKPHDAVVAESVAQKINTRLRWFFGESVFHPEYGVDYFGIVLVKSPDLARIRGEIATVIRSVPEVVSVRNIRTEYDKSKRKLRVSYTAVTEKDVLDEEVNLWTTV